MDGFPRDRAGSSNVQLSKGGSHILCSTAARYCRPAPPGSSYTRWRLRRASADASRPTGSAMRMLSSCCVRGSPAADPTPARALAPLHDQRLPARNLLGGDHLHRLRPARPDDARQRWPCPVEHHAGAHDALPRPRQTHARDLTIAPRVSSREPLRALAWSSWNAVAGSPRCPDSSNPAVSIRPSEVPATSGTH
jgi:hypothetical protein